MKESNLFLNDLNLHLKNHYILVNNNKQEKSFRNLGIDLLRIYSMVNIIILHINSYSKFNLLNIGSPKFKSIWLLNALSFWSVDGFGIISGVVGYNKYKFANLIYIWIQTTFDSFITSSYFYFKGIKDIKFWLSNLFPIATYKYWYVNAYFCMYLFLPLINNGISLLTKNFFRNLLLFYFLYFIIYNIIVEIFLNNDKYNFLNKGFSPLWLIILYIFGAYIGKYMIINDDKTKKTNYFLLWIFIYICSAIFSFISYSFFLKKTYMFKKTLFLSYISPTMIIQAICLLLFFSKLTIKNPLLIKLIIFLTPLTFNVYLFHNRVFDIIFFYDKKFLYNFIITFESNLLFLKIYFLSIIIFIISATIDYIRFLLFKFLKIRKFCFFIENLFSKIFSIF